MNKWILRTLIAGAIAGVLGVIVVFSTIMYFSLSLPKISTLADYKPPIPSQILSKDGHILAEIGLEKREIANVDEIPQRVIDGFLAAEDSSFYEHQGVDYMGVIRALLINLKAGKVVQGGSTITQQVAKSLLLSHERSISRKIKDFLLAQKIEERFSKRDILFLYLNQVYLGGGYYGVKAAIRGYFDKELTEATTAEIAMVAGLLVAPGKYSPYVNPNYAKKRQAYVLGRLYQTSKISKDEYEEALAEKIQFKLRKGNEFKASYFTDWVRQRVIDFIGEESFKTQGYKVHTTLDYELQQVAEKEILEGTKEIDKRQGYKGPLQHVNVKEDPEALSTYIKKFRTEKLKDESTYFVLTDDFQKEYEFHESEEELNEYYENYLQRNITFHNSDLIAGYLDDDKLLPHIREGETYKAVVTKLSKKAQVVFVSIGGVPGVIPYEHFRWAHERVLSETNQYFPQVSDPNSILKIGDIVLVTIREKDIEPTKTFNKSFLSNFQKSKFYKQNQDVVKIQKMLLCELDQEPEVQGALVSLSPYTGEVRSFVGGVDFHKSQFNRAVQSKRQPGSSFKPLLFAASLESGYNPASIILDSPEALGGADSSLNWKPSNYDGKFKGPMTLREALEHSRNIPTIKIAQDIGVEKILDFTKRVGFNAVLDQDLSLSLGSFGVTLLDIVKTYSIFPNGGKRIFIKSITSIFDREGQAVDFDETKFNEIVSDAASGAPANELTQSITQQAVETKVEEKTVAETTEKKEEEVNQFLVNLNETQVYDHRLAYIMTNLLKGVVHNGTGRRALSVSPYLGGKTGTTNNYVDAWFIGFSSSLVTGVWTGFDDNKTLGWAETGSKSALPIWSNFMKAGIKKYGDSDFPVPDGIVNININKKTGKVDPDNGFLEAFVDGTAPKEKEEFVKFNAENAEDIKLLEDEDYYSNQ